MMNMGSLSTDELIHLEVQYSTSLLEHDLNDFIIIIIVHVHYHEDSTLD